MILELWRTVVQTCKAVGLPCNWIHLELA